MDSVIQGTNGFIRRDSLSNYNQNFEIEKKICSVFSFLVVWYQLIKYELNRSNEHFGTENTSLIKEF